MTEILQQLRKEGTSEVLLTVGPRQRIGGRPREDYFGPRQARLRMRLPF